MRKKRRISFIKTVIVLLICFLSNNKRICIITQERVFALERRGIDVSYWQGNVDWRRVKGSGVDFAIIREGYGRRHGGGVDKQFHKNIRNAKANGILCGVYHYSYARNTDDALEEADFCLNNIKGYKLEYPVAFDIEDYSLKPLGKRVLTDICMTFCRRIRERGYYPIIYTNVDWIRNFLYYSELSMYDLWLARYRVRNPIYKCGIWQYSSNGKIDGISGNVDLDKGYVDYPSMIRRLGLNGF